MRLNITSTRVIESLIFLSALAYLFVIPSTAFSQREHLVYFQNTAYELNIYKISGKNPGKTLMLIGGIQGNEPGGFLSADLYADMRLEKGNLIVVPRANFYSIILNHRGAHGDMNRKFTHEDNSVSMEDKIVTILKKLISESDYLLNLHDGAGYYYPNYLDKWRNPSRFGQTIIADCAEYPVPGTDKVLKLGKMAQEIVDDINLYIENDLYKFHFMNTQTDMENSAHTEQRKSATYYALTKHHIPAFGVETSKFLPSVDLKVRYHNLVINSFMKRFGILPQSPGLTLDPPTLKYVVVSVNGNNPMVVKENQPLYLSKGDRINVSHIESNYERGLSLDILGYGELNDFRKDYFVQRDTSMIVRKDNHQFGEIPIRLTKTSAVEPRNKILPEKVDKFIIEAKGSRFILSDGETFHLVKGDKMKIVNVLPSSLGEVTVNFKGFVGDNKNNTGEDRGYEIDTARDLMNRYSINKKGELFRVLVSRGEDKIGELFVKLTPPEWEYLVMRINDDRHVLLRPDESISLSQHDRLFMEEIRTNLYNNSDIHLRINGNRIRLGELKGLDELCSDKENQFNVHRGSLELGGGFINME